ncbi:MAG: dihydrofolate reductase family protein [Fibrobacterales bacterium]
MDYSVFIATSLDGYIATPDGGIDWLMNAGDPGDMADFSYDSFIKNIDVLVMGKNSFEKILTFPDWPYGPIPVIVLSNSLTQLPDINGASLELFSGPLTELNSLLESRNYKKAYIDGGKTIQSFLQAGLITDITITTIPIILGEGLSLFGNISHMIPLEHIETASFNCGIVASRYSVIPKKT